MGSSKRKHQDADEHRKSKKHKKDKKHKKERKRSKRSPSPSDSTESEGTLALLHAKPIPTVPHNTAF